MCRHMTQRKTTLLNVLLCFRLSILHHFIEREATQGQAKLNQKKLLYNNLFSFVCELFLQRRNSLINMPMNSHSATRLAEIDVEINSPPCGNNRTLSKPRRRRQRGHGKTKDLISTTIAQHVRFKTS